MAKNIVIVNTCPDVLKYDNRKAIELAQALGRPLTPSEYEKQGCEYIDDNSSTEIKEQELVNAKELFAERTPANMLIGARGKENITQVQLSKITGIPRRHISDMENGRRPIGKQTALKLEKALNVSYRLFL